MAVSPSGIVVFDIVGANLLSVDARHEMISQFHLDVEASLPEDASLHKYGDGGVLVYSDCDGAYKGLQGVIERWGNVRRATMSPLLVGFRAALHGARDVRERC